MSRESQTKKLAHHALILTYLCIGLAIIVSVVSICKGVNVPEIASVAIASGLGFFCAGIGGKATKGFVTSRLSRGSVNEEK
ncbi:hypothetical protein [Candidatus Borreliella tachyglossi]|uniref:hypothetical protein n=1 Tax=Candidatus Borreliella tachyglossi TaxID=1964448 RepID=UPI0040431B58